MASDRGSERINRRKETISMTALVSYSTGTVSVAAGATTVTGVGLIWSAGSAKPGDIFQIGNFQSVISDVTDATHLVIPPWGGGAQTGVAYKIWQVSPQRFAGAEAQSTVNRLVIALNAREIPVVVSADETVPDPSLGEEDQTAIQPTTGKVWVMTGGVWTYLGIYRGFNLTGAYNGATVYSIGDVMTDAGSSYVWINATPGSGHAAPNATYWHLLASIGGTGATGAVPWGVPADWAAATSYVVGPPASIVRHPATKNLFQCLVPHTSGAFATDLAAGKWLLISQSLTEGQSVTSVAIGTGVKAFATQVGLSYQNGVRLRASSQANTTNWMEGVCAYDTTAQTVTMTVDKTNGSGTFADWFFNRVGEPGAGDVSAANALSEYTGVAATARANLGLTENIVTATVGQLPGTTGTTQPGTGKIGERITATGSPTLTSGVATNIAFVDLTAGVWDLELFNVFGGAGATSSSDWVTAISTVSASISSGVVGFVPHTRHPAGVDYSIVHTAPRERVAVSSTTRYYLNARATFTTSSYSAQGTIQATRV
ncbi:hypothetical protein ACVWW4_003694 [Bradyrhizobium sp. LB7.1]